MKIHAHPSSRKDGLRRPDSAHRTPSAFTLIELLTVISIIAILAALLLPAIAKAKVQAQKRKAQLEIGQIGQAILRYESDYSKFPVSSVVAMSAMSEASRLGEDFTFGTAGVTCVGPGGPVTPVGSFKTPNGTFAVSAPGNYQANNSEVMAVLLDVENWPGPPLIPTINQRHVKNPQKTHYLNAPTTSFTTSPGVGPDGVYRDPWGNPYIITVDLNYDDKARDAFYRLGAVSRNTGTSGFNGLVNVHTPPSPPNGSGDYFECNSPVMIWSAGPDKMIDQNAKATAGANRDNILSWKD